MKDVIAKKINYTLNYLRKYLSKPKYVNCGSIKLHIDKNKFTDKVIRAFHKGNYEQDERDILLSTLGSNDRYLEIGAGVGYMGINAAKIVKTSDQIFLFEANPEMAKVIKINMKLNEQNLFVLNKAIISSNDEKIPFYLNEDFWISSTLNKKNTHKITINALSMESILKKYQPTYLMIDVEGGEYDLFTNSKMNKSVRKICFEVHPNFISSEKITKIFKVLIKEDFTVDFNVSRKNVYYLYR
jgi:FkbM family methyltransferase